VHATSAKQGPTALDREIVNDLEFFRTQPLRGLRHTLPILNQLSIVTGLRRRLVELIRQESPTLLHVHSPCLNALAALPIARRVGIPLIYEVRALWEDGAVDSGVCREGDLRYRVSRMLETHVCLGADHVVTICDGVRDADLAARHRLTAGKTCGFIGTFFPFEGLEVLMNAVPTIRAKEPQARFLIVGDGADASRIRELARRLAIEDVVTFTGRVPHDQVERYYGLIDILTYPRISKRVTELVTPLKPLEAMAQGKIVVASDVGGHREMVFPGQNGMLFKAGDATSLAGVCVDLLSRPQDWPAFRENGRKYVTASRNWAQNVRIYSQLYAKFAE